MIDYNFYDLFKSIDDLCKCVREDEDSTATETICMNIQKELNKFFKDFECTEVLYTLNTDKNFFGIQVRPTGLGNPMKLIGALLKPEYEPFAFTRYQIEFDSKLFNSSLTPSEIGTILLLDINSMSGTQAVTKVRDAIDAITVFSDRPISQQITAKMSSLFQAIVENTMRNLTSVFCKSSTELRENVDVPDFIAGYKLVDSYTSAINKLISMCGLETDCEYPTILLTWFLNIYQTSIESRYVLQLLRKALHYEGSTLVKRALTLALKDFSELTPRELNNIEAVTESRKGLIYQMKRNGLRSLEDDLYEYNMRLRNVETQDEAILLMRQINSRMGILEDYLREDDIDEKDRKRWEDCYHKYLELREALSKKSVYNKKMYGLFVDYNALQNMSSTGQLMNTYY